MENLLATYPRARPLLTDAHKKIYAQEYKKTRGEEKPLTSKVSSGVSGWMHRKIAKKHHNGVSLEIGAGTLNHLSFEPADVVYDIIEPFTYLYSDNPTRKRIRHIYSDVRDVPEVHRYGRIISVAALEHLTELPYTVARSGIMLEEDGIFQAGIPSEGGLLWGVAWRCSTGIAYRLRTGLDYKTLMRHEHINQAKEIMSIVRHFFKDVRVQYFPLPGIHLSIFVYLEARAPNVEKCRTYLDKYSQVYVEKQ